jgi:hypothetical protein
VVTSDCRHCGGVVAILGALGRIVYGSCRQCGETQPTPFCHECYGQGDIEAENPDNGIEYCRECEGTGLGRAHRPLTRLCAE